MKHACPKAVATAAFYVFRGSALAATETGVAFTSGRHTCLGRFALLDHALSVNIDGWLYCGHYAALAEDEGAAGPAAPPVGRWNRAFLFSSSAKILQCQLAAKFPRVSGWCQGANDRQFELRLPLKP